MPTARLVTYWSDATNLVSSDSNGSTDVFLRTMFATMALDKTALAFGAVTSGPTFVSQTAAQSVRLMQSGNSTVTWTVASNQPWLQVSPVSGTGSGTLSIGVVPTAGLPPSGTVTNEGNRVGARRRHRAGEGRQQAIAGRTAVIVVGAPPRRRCR